MLASSYLQTAARIIAEDDTHAVVAVRIPKALIAANLALLAALSDLVSKRPSVTQDTPPITPPHPD